MKKISFLFAILFAAGLNISKAQNTWTSKANIGGTGRQNAVGFNIGNKGYLGTGAFGTYYKDFWEYDPDTNTWTQKADFGGGARTSAVGFSIGSKGYLGTGGDISQTQKKDFWEYDPDANTWTQKADFGGVACAGAVGFSIGSKGYLGTGFNGQVFNQDFWEYDPTLNTWTQKADFGGAPRSSAIGFSIGSKGYLGTGFTSGNYFKDFWEYDPDTNTWTQKADFGGTPRYSAVGFNIGSKGYLGTGYDGIYKKDFWEYDQDDNTWTLKSDFGGTNRYSAVGFSIGTRGYMGTGFNSGHYFKDFWEYAPENSSCLEPMNLMVTNITSSSAKLTWTTVPGAEGYDIRYKVNGSNGWLKTHTSNNFKKLPGLSPATEYKWQIKTYCQLEPIITSDWSSSQTFTTSPQKLDDESIEQFSLQIYPNPAEDDATIQFALSQSSHIYIRVYDVSGKDFAGQTLLDADVEQGDHSLLLITNHFSKGVYIVKLISDFGTENQKLIVQ